MGELRPMVASSAVGDKIQWLLGRAALSYMALSPALVEWDMYAEQN